MPVKSNDLTAFIPRQTAPVRSEPPAQPWRPGRDDGPPPPEPLDAPWLRVVAWAAPMVVVAVLSLIGIGTPGLWEDELQTWGMVTASWPDFRSVLAGTDAGVAPYYLLLRVWTDLAGTSDAMLRLPSALAMVGATGLVAALGVRLGGLRVGLAAGLLFAVLPTTSRYAQEARPDAFTVLAAALATLLLVRLLDRPRIGRYLGYLAALVLLGLGHVLGLLLLLAHAVIAWRLRPDGRTVAGWALTAVLAVVLVGPVVHFARRQAGGDGDWIPPVSLARVAEAPAVLFGDLLIGGALLACAFLAMSMRGRAAVATAWALLPTAGLLAVSLVVPTWLPRYLLFTLPAWVLLASLAVRRTTIARGVGVVLAIGLLGLPGHLDIRTPTGHGQGTRDIAAVMRAHAAPGDTVVYGPTEGGDQRLARDAVLRYVPPGIAPQDRLARTRPRTGGSVGARECAAGEVADCLGQPDRIWLVRKGNRDDPLAGLGAGKTGVLESGYVVMQTWRVRAFTIVLYVSKPR
ncbi:glycosyltransferase family 39 protein [Polymorphospora sp. NPDC051019]|uniref:glycosyltransferase family 39 protein n=1 Tax=Polymorphospora sp. NPDC051019 TaxID=3155725 RepID=UPI003449C3F7